MKNKFYRVLARYISEQDGVTGLEYGIIAGGVGALSMFAVLLVGDSYTAMFDVFSGFLQDEIDNL